jgi:hypothetical protein
MAAETKALLPSPRSSMIRVHNLASDLPRAIKNVEEIKEIVDIVLRV